MSKYYSINKFSKILGVSAQTLRNWDAILSMRPLDFENSLIFKSVFVIQIV